MKKISKALRSFFVKEETRTFEELIAAVRREKAKYSGMLVRNPTEMKAFYLQQNEVHEAVANLQRAMIQRLGMDTEELSEVGRSFGRVVWDENGKPHVQIRKTWFTDGR